MQHEIISKKAIVFGCLQYGIRQNKLCQIRVNQYHIWGLPEEFMTCLQKQLVPGHLNFWNENKFGVNKSLINLLQVLLRSVDTGHIFLLQKSGQSSRKIMLL